MWDENRQESSAEDRHSESGWGHDADTLAAQTPKPRVVQYRGRRYSIRLEQVFWTFLEYLAERRSLRLGRYVAGLAAGHDGNNLSSYLRVVCMLEAQRTVAEAALDPARGNLLALVGDCPSPGIVLSRSRTILGYNAAFSRWLGPGPRVRPGSDLGDVLQLRTAGSLNDLWAGMVAGTQGTVKAQVLRVSPGRVNAAQAAIVPLRADAGDGFYAVLWLERARPASAVGRTCT